MNRLRKLGMFSALVAIATMVLGAGSAPAITPVSCPSFRILHNDRIGPAVLPAGNYVVTIAPTASLSCAAASKLLTRFLADYDGVLPQPWRVVAQGSGKASFNQGARAGFSVTRSGGEESGRSPVGVLCRGSFTVNSNATIGPLAFPKGSYLLYIPPRSGISCNRASVLFTRFLGAGGRLPSPWRVQNQTATFFKPENPTRSAFRVEPLTGAGPA
ncbi:MAG TPA: hypothetical protein VGO36_01780 [Solirubrobacterales bacterium]|nr:hypothetical protein [Solirubrobacterales bacterium]